MIEGRDKSTAQGADVHLHLLHIMSQPNHLSILRRRLPLFTLVHKLRGGRALQPRGRDSLQKDHRGRDHLM
jgi:hypothetical protein